MRRVLGRGWCSFQGESGFVRATLKPSLSFRGFEMPKYLVGFELVGSIMVEAADEEAAREDVRYKEGLSKHADYTNITWVRDGAEAEADDAWAKQKAEEEDKPESPRVAIVDLDSEENRFAAIDPDG